jgi:AraC family transcriptional regulator of adaptative response/methylated-DNA-[protein]-cysteine methyltransferase
MSALGAAPLRSAYDTVAQAIAFIRAHATAQPRLAEVARHVGYSEAHFQRLFTDWAGVSPTRFLQFLTKGHALTLLAESRSVEAAALESGLSGAGRLHDLLVTWEAMTPGEIRQGGAGVAIDWGVAATPLGWMAVGSTARGICHLSFLDEAPEAPAVADRLRQSWPQAALHHRPEVASALAERLFGAMREGAPLHLLLRGSPFRVKVWEALLRIPAGSVCSYGELAARAGAPRAARAVGSAMATNDIALIIPCHRVIRESGQFGEYRWNPVRKAALLGWEQARRHG